MSPERQAAIRALKCFPLLVGYDIVGPGDGYLRLCTALTYPDGSNVDLFLKEQTPLFPGRVLDISDLGQSLQYLHELGIDPLGNPQRRVAAHLQAVCEALGVGLRGEEMYVTMTDAKLEPPLAADSGLGVYESRFESRFSDETRDRFAASVLALATAAVRVADIEYAAGQYKPNTFRDSLRQRIQAVPSLRLEPKTDHEFPLRDGGSVAVDFVVRGASRRSAVITVTGSTPTYVESAANRAFVRWYRMKEYGQAHRVERVTVFDDSREPVREDMVKVLRHVSHVFPSSDRAAWTEFLAA